MKQFKALRLTQDLHAARFPAFALSRNDNGWWMRSL
jgi:hypothetical protein